MRHLVLFCFFLLACTPAEDEIAIPRTIESITWVNATNGVINGNMNFSLWGYLAPRLNNPACEAEKVKAVKAHEFMALMTQDISTLKLKTIHAHDEADHYLVTLTQEGHDLGALGFSWNHLVPEKLMQHKIQSWCAKND